MISNSLRVYISKIAIDGFLSETNGKGSFCLNFSDALNCLIGGRGTGKSSVLEILEYVMSQRCESEQLLDFICAHGNTWVLYEYQGDEYLIEMRMPYKTNKDHKYTSLFRSKFSRSISF